MSNIYFDGETGQLKYALWKKQEEAMELFKDRDIDLTDFRAGYRAGKSYLGARAILILAWEQDGSKWAVMADSYREGIRSTFEVLFQNLPGYSGDNPENSPIVDEFHKQDMTLSLTNGSKILLATAQKYDSLKGTELSGAWLDEIAFYGNLYDTVEMVMSRMSADYTVGVLTTTTTNGFNDYYDIFEEGVKPDTGESHSWRIETVRADVRDNPTISEEVKERLERTHSGNEEEGLLGGFSADEGRVFPSFGRDTHVVRNVEDVKDEWRVYGVDYGFNDPTVVLEVGQTEGGEIVVLNEFYKSEADLEEAEAWLNARPTGRVFGDHHPREQKRIRNNTNHRVNDAVKGKEDGVLTVKGFMEHDNERSPDLYVHSRCSNLIQELVSYTRDILGGGNGDDHAVDALRYALHSPDSSVFDSNDRKGYGVKTSDSSDGGGGEATYESIPTPSELEDDRNSLPR